MRPLRPRILLSSTTNWKNSIFVVRVLLPTPTCPTRHLRVGGRGLWLINRTSPRCRMTMIDVGHRHWPLWASKKAGCVSPGIELHLAFLFSCISLHRIHCLISCCSFASVLVSSHSMSLPHLLLFITHHYARTTSLFIIHTYKRPCPPRFPNAHIVAITLYWILLTFSYTPVLSFSPRLCLPTNHTLYILLIISPCIIIATSPLGAVLVDRIRISYNICSMFSLFSHTTRIVNPHPLHILFSPFSNLHPSCFLHT